MNVIHLPIYQFLEGSGKSFVIPVYQRDYAWTKINCQKLWDDIVDLSYQGRNDHFLGTLVTIGSGFQEYTIIDGQQRLTTISIMLIALHNYLKQQDQLPQQEQFLSEQVLEFLINKYAPEKHQRIRLKPNQQDQTSFASLFEDDRSFDGQSNIINNYKFFYDKISSGQLSPSQFFQSFQKLKIVLIDLVREQDDPQLIFESLNSTGVDLTAGDLIRNYILMDLPPIEQDQMYKNYWLKIENLVGNLAEFVRNYLIYQEKVSVKRDDVYTVFKKFAVKQFNNDKETIVKDLLYFAEIYSWLVQIRSHNNTGINHRLLRLNKIEFTVCHPYLFDVFNDLKQGFLTEDAVTEILAIIESYAFRKIIVDNSTQGLNKMFITFSKEIKKETSWKSSYLEILKFKILEKTASQRFPNNQEFETALIYKEIYRTQSKNKNFLLESLENHNSSYKVNLEELTIEHIMPQKLTKDWKESLGDNWQEIHKKYLHTLGNLSLTAKNQQLSNQSWEDKQAIDYQESKLKLNFKLDRATQWKEEEIVKRGKRLAQEALQIWSYPETKYEKNQPDEQLFDLSSEDSFSGSKPAYLYIENEDAIKLKTWKDLLVYVCRYLYDFSPTEFKHLQNSPEFRWNFDIEKPLRRATEFAENNYVEGNISANGTITFLGKLCERMNYPPEKISFSVKNQK